MISYLTLFLLVFDIAIPPVKAIGSAPIAAMISLGILILNEDSRYKFSQVFTLFRPVVVVYSLAFSIVLIRLLFSGAYEVSYLFSFIKASIIFLASILYFSTFDISDLPNKLINIFFINGIICLIFGSFTVLLPIVYAFKPGMPDPGFIPYRNAFLSGSGYFGIGAPYALMIALTCYAFVNSNKNVFIHFIKFAVICAAGIIAARTAFLGIVFGTLYLAVKKPILSVVISIAFMSCLIVLFSLDMFSDYSSWVFEFFNSDSSDSQTGTGSTDNLMTMYFMPKPLTLIFGDGQYTNGDLYYMNTDAGYMRNILFGGIFFTFILAMIPYYLSKISSNDFYRWVLFPLVLIIHVKGAFILNNPTAMPLLILIAAWFSLNERAELSAFHIKDDADGELIK